MRTPEQLERNRVKQRERNRLRRELINLMTPEEVDEIRKKQKEYRLKYLAKNPDADRIAQRRYRERHKGEPDFEERKAYHAFTHNQRNPARRLKSIEAWTTWKKSDPESARQSHRNATKRYRLRIENRSKILRWSRKAYVKRVKDRDALAQRVTSAAEAATPKQLPPDIRIGVVGLLVERVYSGDLPIKLTPEHGKSALADYRRENDRSGYETVSLDDVLGDDGFTRGVAMGIY